MYQIRVALLSTSDCLVVSERITMEMLAELAVSPLPIDVIGLHRTDSNAGIVEKLKLYEKAGVLVGDIILKEKYRNRALLHANIIGEGRRILLIHLVNLRIAPHKKLPRFANTKRPRPCPECKELLVEGAGHYWTCYNCMRLFSFSDVKLYGKRLPGRKVRR